MQGLRDNPKSKDWTIFIPIILEIIKKLIENRNKSKTEELGPQIVAEQVKNSVSSTTQSKNSK
jgi:hypothetical protein